MPHTYRYLRNPDNERFDLSKVALPSHIGTWPPHADDNPITLGLISGGEIQSGIDAVRKVYPDAEIVDAHGGARPGAGRKTIAPDEPTKVTTVRLPQSHYDRLAAQGNVADAIRVLVKQAIEKQVE